MTPVKQRHRHDPANGVWGDCTAAALASLLDLELDDVPHFFDGGVDAAAAECAMIDWLRTRGLMPINIVFDCDNVADVLDCIKATNHHTADDLLYLLGGTSRNNCGHTVVCRGARIIHDPSLDDAGIVGPMPDGLFWITFITRELHDAAH